MQQVALWILCLLILGAAGCLSVGTIPQTGCYKRAGLAPKIEAVIDEFRASVPEMMKKGKVPGCAIALVDVQGTLWTEGFGYNDRKKKIPVTPDTPFLICSMSKTFTATAVMIAVQEGLLDLDEPTTTYLPDFKVYSRYEEYPEQKITLRGLLSHTAGIPHEAAGSNMLEVTGSFEQRVRSLYGTWLKCPVGQAYSYSGAGMDLAAYVLQVVSDIPFEQYLKERIFVPLKMSNSTLDKNEILSNPDRAIGHMIGIAKFPSTHSLLGAGGVFTSAADLARFVRLHINKGTLEGKRLLDDSLIDGMLAPHALIDDSEDEDYYYGLGVIIGRSSKKEGVIVQHSGGGGGFSSFMHWYPEYGIGALALTNKSPFPASVELPLTLTDRLIKEKLVEKRFAAPTLECIKCVPKWNKWAEHKPTPYKPEWRKYCGNYNPRFSGYKFKWWARLALALNLDRYTPSIKVYESDGHLCLTESRFFEMLEPVWTRHVRQKLQEARPGLFFTAYGGALDFRGEIPTWRNWRLKKR